MIKMKDRKNMNWTLIFAALIILLSIVSLVFSFVNYLNKPIEKREFEVKFSVEEGRAGFDINGTALTFGIIPPGGGGTRKIDIENKYDFPVKVKFSISNNLADYLELPREMFLEKGQKETAIININMPRDAEQTNYTGIFRIEFYKVEK